MCKRKGSDSQADLTFSSAPRPRSKVNCENCAARFIASCGTEEEHEQKNTIDLLHWNQNGCILVFEKKYQELGWHCLAGIATNGVNVVGAFVKSLSSREG